MMGAGRRWNEKEGIKASGNKREGQARERRREWRKENKAGRAKKEKEEEGKKTIWTKG